MLLLVTASAVGNRNAKHTMLKLIFWILFMDLTEHGHLNRLVMKSILLRKNILSVWQMHSHLQLKMFWVGSLSPWPGRLGLSPLFLAKATIILYTGGRLSGKRLAWSVGSGTCLLDRTERSEGGCWDLWNCYRHNAVPLRDTKANSVNWKQYSSKLMYPVSQ